MRVGCEESHASSHVLDRGTGPSLNLPYFCIYAAHQGGLVLWYSTGSLTRRRIRDTAGYKKVSHGFEGVCVMEKGDDVFASRNGTLFGSSVACVELL